VSNDSCTYPVFGIPKSDKEARVEEDSYRQSRLCRLLGNPIAFAVVQPLAENKELNQRDRDSGENMAASRSTPRMMQIMRAAFQACVSPNQQVTAPKSHINRLKLGDLLRLKKLRRLVIGASRQSHQSSQQHKSN